MCVVGWPTATWGIGTKIYNQVSPIIKEGESRRFGPQVFTYRNPKGWQAIMRVSRDHRRALAVIHAFEKPCPEQITVPLQAGGRMEHYIHLPFTRQETQYRRIGPHLSRSGRVSRYCGGAQTINLWNRIAFRRMVN